MEDREEGAGGGGSKETRGGGRKKVGTRGEPEVDEGEGQRGWMWVRVDEYGGSRDGVRNVRGEGGREGRLEGETKGGEKERKAKGKRGEGERTDGASFIYTKWLVV